MHIFLRHNVIIIRLVNHLLYNNQRTNLQKYRSFKSHLREPWLLKYSCSIIPIKGDVAWNQHIEQSFPAVSKICSFLKVHKCHNTQHFSTSHLFYSQTYPDFSWIWLICKSPFLTIISSFFKNTFCKDIGNISIDVEFTRFVTSKKKRRNILISTS